MKATRGISYVEVIMAMVLVGLIVTPAMSGIWQIRKNLDWTEHSFQQNIVSRNIMDGVINLMDGKGIEYVKKVNTENWTGIQLLQKNGIDTEAIKPYTFDILIQEIVPPNIEGQSYFFSNGGDHHEIIHPIITKDPQGLLVDAYLEPYAGKDIVIDTALPVSIVSEEAEVKWNGDVCEIKIAEASKAVSIYIKTKAINSLKIYIENQTEQSVLLDIVHEGEGALNPNNIRYMGKGALVTTTKKVFAQKNYFIIVNLYDVQNHLVKRQGMIV